MRAAAFALLPLLLTGAAPAPSTILDLTECRLPTQAMHAALDTLELQKTIEADDGPRHRTVRVYRIPAGLAPFGLAPTTLTAMETHEPGNDRIMVTTTYTEPYARVEAAVLATHGLTACDPNGPRGGGSCGVFDRAPDAEGWSMTLAVQQASSAVFVACGYFPPKQ